MARSPRAWGWHELDPNWARRLVADADLRPGALVLDVGAGRGSITDALLDAGARVVAVELHAARARRLEERFGSTVRVVRADATDLRLPRRPFHVVANPPFSITAALLRRLLAPGSRLVSARIVLQHQAARRWSSPSAPGLGRWGRTFRAEYGPRVARQAFRPPPRVDGRVLRIDRR
ncbi:MAG: rRNA adenine N(6)-methyltransferase family protein [Actinomycetota bacterium]